MRSIQKRSILVLAFAGLIFFSYYQQYISFEWVHTCASYFSYPVLYLQKSIVSKWHARVTEKKTIESLEEKLGAARQQQHQLLAENVSLRAAQKYQNDIFELIDFKQRYNPMYGTIAQILVKHLAHDGHYFLVAAGSNKGVKPDMVATYKSFLIGKVTDVYPWYSKVSLITDEGCKIAAYCDKTNACGIHEGCNEMGRMALKFVSHLDEIQEGDLVVSSGKGLIFPRGFALGRIAAAKREELFHLVEVEPLITMADLEYIMLIDKGALES